ncbi:alpha/beta hydrolase [Polaribacter pacificus]|uniref:Alpha/beta hydrolase n=1 Tax=Polaribacter pacificus TaxID=1775173 RepID=A0A917HV58_9FLAO|nr:alpha/beta hydrolase [Polaribacter pacificus]GGG92266.1 alpha/beta hydrolase [Polaribacter pacificus]
MKRIYFLSGTMCNEDLWKKIFALKKEYIPVYIDITSASSFDEINDLIFQAIDTSAVLVGFSMGGFAALNFARLNPQKISKLILIAASDQPLSDAEIKLRKNTIQLLQDYPYKGISKTRINQFLHPDNQTNTEIIRLIKRMDQELGKDVLIRQLKATSERIDISKSLIHLTAPITLVGSQNDALVSYKKLEAMASKLPNAKLICIDHAGHMIPLEQPCKLSDILNHEICT